MYRFGPAPQLTHLHNWTNLRDCFPISKNHEKRVFFFRNHRRGEVPHLNLPLKGVVWGIASSEPLQMSSLGRCRTFFHARTTILSERLILSAHRVASSIQRRSTRWRQGCRCLKTISYMWFHKPQKHSRKKDRKWATGMLDGGVIFAKSRRSVVGTDGLIFSFMLMFISQNFNFQPQIWS